MTIENIKIKEIKGIKELEINQKIFANKPNILVGVNGFGKTSIATAFASIQHKTCIDLKDIHCYQENPHNNPFIELTHSGNTYCVDKNLGSNEIRKHFDIFVIKDMRKADGEIKQVSQDGGDVKYVPLGKMVTEPLKICEIEKAETLKYKVTEARKILKLTKINDVTKSLSNDIFLSKIDDVLSDTKKQMFNFLEEECNKIADENDVLLNQNKILEKFSKKFKDKGERLVQIFSLITETENVLYDLLQYVFLFNRDKKNLENYLNRIRYTKFKKNLKDEINTLENAWCKSTLSEKGKWLYLHLPEPHKISNGQRDVTILCGAFNKILYNSKKKNFIVIIDEIFDYLDDANLISCQYYVTKLIATAKENGKCVYPIMLTHLDPEAFKSYVFNKRNIIYLGHFESFKLSSAMASLIYYRSNKDGNDNLKNKISKYLLHYNLDDADFQSEMENNIKGIRKTWGDPKKFNIFLKEQLSKYQKGEVCDPLAICAITRLKVEECAYNQISSHPNASQFFLQHKTIDKLKWAVDKGAIIPEHHYLLKVLFDDAMHWNEHKSINPISAKLKHPVIKNMILNLF